MAAINAVSILAALVLAPTQGSQPIDWVVDMRGTASGIAEVRGLFSHDTVEPHRRLRLEFPDARQLPDAIKSISARQGDHTCNIIRSETAPNVWWISLRSGTEPLEIVYTIDPTFFPPGSITPLAIDARSRITQDLAIVRTASLFPNIDESARVRFELPDHWHAITPWRRKGDWFHVSGDELTRVDYLAFGPFDTQTVLIDTSEILFATPPGSTAVTPRRLESLVRVQQEMAGVSLAGSGLRTIVVVPTGFMRGGAAGSRSVVQRPGAVILAHEIFHWWLHGELGESEARWFTEGFTNYFAIKAAGKSEMWNQRQMEACLSDLEAEMRHLETERAVSLANASKAYGSDPRSRRLVYSKGTLFGLRLDRTLAQRGRRLEEVLWTLLKQQRTGVTNKELKDVFADALGAQVSSQFDAIVLQASELPDSELPAADGTSGCARFLPRP